MEVFFIEVFAAYNNDLPHRLGTFNPLFYYDTHRLRLCLVMVAMIIEEF